MFRYHMQLSGNITNLHGTKSPPTPMVQTSVSANHSRNVSQSSGTSNDVQQLPVTVALPSVQTLPVGTTNSTVQ